jgi:hypothetical protein
MPVKVRLGVEGEQKNRKCDRDPQEDWCLDEAFGCKPPVVKCLHPLEVRARKSRGWPEPESGGTFTFGRSY